MKKHEIKSGRTKPPEVRTREQIENETFNRMLLWVAVAAVVEVVMVLINRFYINTRVSELNAKIVLYYVLTALPFVGAALFVILLVVAVRMRRSDTGKDGTLQVAMAFGFLCMGVCGLLMRNYESTVAPMVLAVVPGLGVLMMVFYLYPKEFFACGIVGGLGLLGLWVYRTLSSGTIYYAYLILTVGIAAAGAVLAWKLKKAGGVWKGKNRSWTLLQSDAAYLPYYLTAVITLVLLLLPLVVSAMGYYGVWAVAAWLFILAVYFTAKLM